MRCSFHECWFFVVVSLDFVSADLNYEIIPEKSSHRSQKKNSKVIYLFLVCARRLLLSQRFGLRSEVSPVGMTSSERGHTRKSPEISIFPSF